MKDTCYGVAMSSIVEQALTLTDIPANDRFRYSEMIAYAQERYGYIYEQMSTIDPWFYGMPIRADKQDFVIPLGYRNVAPNGVFEAQDPHTKNREIYQEAANRERESFRTFSIEGRHVHIWSVGRSSYPIWVLCIPYAPRLSFTMYNRDAYKIYQPSNVPPHPTGPQRYNYYNLVPTLLNGVFTRIEAVYIPDNAITLDLTPLFAKDDNEIVRFIVDRQYVFVSYRNTVTDEFSTYVYEDIMADCPVEYKLNAYDYTGRGTRIRVEQARVDRYTGMGLIVYDQEDNQYKEIGCFVDTVINYPSDVGINLLVAQLAQRWMMRNNLQKPAVMEALASSKMEFENYLKVNKASWQKIALTQPMYSHDWW